MQCLAIILCTPYRPVLELIFERFGLDMGTSEMDSRSN